MKVKELFETTTPTKQEDDFTFANKESVYDWIYDYWAVQNGSASFIHYYTKFRKAGNFPKGLFELNKIWKREMEPIFFNENFWHAYSDEIDEMEQFEEHFHFDDDDGLIIKDDFTIDAKHKFMDKSIYPPPFKIKECYGNVYYENFDKLEDWLPEIIEDKFFIFNNNEKISLKGIHKIVKECDTIEIARNTKATNILDIFKINNLKGIIMMDNRIAERIINDNLFEQDVLKCQQELMDAGFDDMVRA